MTTKKLEKLSEEYVKTQDLKGSMETAGYSTSKGNVSHMRQSARFRETLRHFFDKMILEVLLDVGRTGQGSTRVRALKEAKAMICGSDETPSASGGGEEEDKDKQLPDTAW